jgi:hypothetical protein
MTAVDQRTREPEPVFEFPPDTPRLWRALEVVACV